MSYKRPGSTYYMVNRALTGFGKSGVLSTRVRDKRAADRMEGSLVTLAERALSEPHLVPLVEAVQKRVVTLPQLHMAVVQNRLSPLARSLSDPTLAEAIEQARRGAGRVVGYGLDKIAAYHGPKARASVLLDPRSVEKMLRDIEATGLMRNTVHRQVHVAASRVLRHLYGNSERNRVMADVDFSPENDTRRVYLSGEQIGDLLRACYAVRPDLGTATLLALLTGADRGTLFRGQSGEKTMRGLLRSDVSVHQYLTEPGEESTYWAEVSLRHDSKAETRSRSVVTGDALARELLLLVQGRGPSEPVFSVTYQMLTKLWRRAITKAGLLDASGEGPLRFKDLRSQYAVWGEEAKLPSSVVSESMGHATEVMTQRYRKTKRTMTPEQAQLLESTMLGAAGGLETLRRAA